MHRVRPHHIDSGGAGLVSISSKARDSGCQMCSANPGAGFTSPTSKGVASPSGTTIPRSRLTGSLQSAGALTSTNSDLPAVGGGSRKHGLTPRRALVPHTHAHGTMGGTQRRNRAHHKSAAPSASRRRGTACSSAA